MEEPDLTLETYYKLYSGGVDSYKTHTQVILFNSKSTRISILEEKKLSQAKRIVGEKNGNRSGTDLW